MGAEITYVVRVRRLTDDYVHVHAVTSSEAMREAEKLPGVAMVVDAWPHSEDMEN
jgi:hypothetical protein